MSIYKKLKNIYFVQYVTYTIIQLQLKMENNVIIETPTNIKEHCTKKSDFKTRENNLTAEIEAMLKCYYERAAIKTYLSGEIRPERTIFLANE